MDHFDVKTYWNKNAEEWRKASDRGLDIVRDHVNTPAFLNILPNISEKIGLDIGCGEGHNTRLIAKRCKHLFSIDLSEEFINFSERENLIQGIHNITHSITNVAAMEFDNHTFDFAVATMAMMDIFDQKKVFQEIFRVLKPSTFFQFSIMHPCFDRVSGRWIHDENKKRIGFVSNNYFSSPQGKIQKFIHTSLAKRRSSRTKYFEVPRFLNTLSQWLNLLLEVGFQFEQFHEPYADNSVIKKHPDLESTRIVANSLIIRVKKP